MRHRRFAIQTFAVLALFTFAPADAAGRRDLQVELHDGRGHAVSLEGAEGRALATADFDEDGIPDVVAGFAQGMRGSVVLVLGDPDAIYPFAPGAQRRRAKDRLEPAEVAPLRADAAVFDLPLPADALGAGDFDNDGHRDVVAAGDGGRSLCLLRGDGRGGFAEPVLRTLPGRVTRMVTGEMNHADGLPDIVVAIDRGGRSQILVFEGPEGAWKAEPETIDVGDPVTLLALGDLDGDFEGDLVAGVKNGLVLVRGRDRRLSSGAAARAEVLPPATERHRLDFTPLRGVVERPGRSSASSLLLLGDDGSLHAAEAGTLDRPHDTSGLLPETPAVTLRLGPGADDSRVLLNASGPALLSVVPPALPTTFTVTSTADSGPGSLRQAILDANANPGADTIAFNIASLQPPIKPLSPLPEVTDPVTIDGTTQPGYAGLPLVEIDGSGPLPSGTSGLTVFAGPSVVRGLDIHGFSGSGIVLDRGGHSAVEANLIGLDRTGTSAIPNQDGVAIHNSAFNTIGGTAAAARNVISGNTQRGVAILGQAPITEETVAPGPAVAICDLCTVTMPLPVSDERLIEDVKVRVTLSHTYDSDLVITLIAPDGTRILLANRRGGSGHGYAGTLFDDGAATPIAAGLPPFLGTYRPEESLSILNGRNARGTWTLEVMDTAGGDVGTLSSWSLVTAAETLFSNVVEGNLIGTDVTGTVALGNAQGVVIDQSPLNTVGGSVTGARNVIAGSTDQSSGHGVTITGWPALNALQNTVQGNFIGTDISGTLALPNKLNGVEIDFADRCQIGGTAAGSGNLISGNGRYGVHTSNSSWEQIQGNTLGTDVTGTVGISHNTTYGVLLDYATSNTLVGGSAPGARNLASGNLVGIGTEGYPPDSFSNAILGNYVGTDPGGTKAVPNGIHGIRIDSPLVQVGGPGPGEGNLASGNNVLSDGSSGIVVTLNGESCTVQGNIIGLDRTGTVKLGNNRGLLINAGSYNTYGGANPGEGNVIAGNDSHGVWINDPAGNTLPEMDNATDTPQAVPDLSTITSTLFTQTITSDLLERVTVTVELAHTYDSDLVLTLTAPNGKRIVLANREGGDGDDYWYTQFDDSAAVPVGLGAAPFTGSFRPEQPLGALSGIPTAGPWTLEVADTAAGDFGTLLGWSLNFTYLTGYSANYQAQIVGNFIGTNAAGAGGLGNGGDGVFGEVSGMTTVGAPGAPNVISGNTGHGVFLSSPFVAANVVQSNLIGLKPDGVTPLGNGSDGVATIGPVGLIGGTSPAYGNRIAWNGGAGVNVLDNTATRQTTVRSNSIHDNGGLGIDLGPTGVTANDPGDGDAGANGLQNFPSITSVVPSAMNSVLISGGLSSAPNGTYIIDVYGTPQADPSGYGEGRTWLGAATFTTDSGGHVSWSVLTGNGALGLITATATDFAGNTSEFSGLAKTPQEASPAKTMQAAPGSGGTVDITYAPACGATDHTLYWGTMGPGMIGGAGMVWTKALCGLGTSGIANVVLPTPPVGQGIFFTIAGQNGSVEGSYGQDSNGAEEPEAVLPIYACDRPQFLGGGCF